MNQKTLPEALNDLGASVGKLLGEIYDKHFLKILLLVMVALLATVFIGIWAGELPIENTRIDAACHEALGVWVYRHDEVIRVMTEDEYIRWCK